MGTVKLWEEALVTTSLIWGLKRIKRKNYMKKLILLDKERRK